MSASADEHGPTTEEVLAFLRQILAEDASGKPVGEPGVPPPHAQNAGAAGLRSSPAGAVETAHLPICQASSKVLPAARSVNVIFGFSD